MEKEIERSPLELTDAEKRIHYVGRASKESMEAVDQALKISMGVE